MKKNQCTKCGKDLLKHYALYQLKSDGTKEWATDICGRCENQIVNDNNTIKYQYSYQRYVDVNLMQEKYMNWIQLVKSYFPDITDDQADFILWEYTGFPSFWHLTKEYPTPISRCRKQLRQLKYNISKNKLKNLINYES